MDKVVSYNQIIATSVNSLSVSDWESISADKNIYFSIEYLQALEKSMVNEIDFFYSIVYNEDKKPVLISVFQLVKFTDKRKNHSKAIFSHFHGDGSCKDELLVNVLVCGNVFSNGENGFLWNNLISNEEAVNQILVITDRIKKHKETRKKLSIILFKEFWPDSVGYTDAFKEHSYRDFMIDVNMVLTIHPDWKAMDAYLLSMKAKFRTKANSVFKKSKELVIKNFETKDISENLDKINELFENVVSKSEYNLGKLCVTSFIEWKKSLKENFLFRALYLDNKIVGFSTAFANGDNLEANYVGIDYEYNIEHCVYQKLLYDYIEQAIQINAKQLHLGRTSELVKSALGALPVNMKLYAKHKSSITNVLMKPIF